jgi:hypothetical protein
VASKHELWKEEDADATEYAFFLSRHRDMQQLGPNAQLIWTVDADSYAEAMTKYYEFMDWGKYKVMSPEDWEPYSLSDQ